MRMIEAQCFSLQMILTIGDSDRLTVSGKYQCGSHAISLPLRGVEDTCVALGNVQRNLIKSISKHFFLHAISPWRQRALVTLLRRGTVIEMRLFQITVEILFIVNSIVRCDSKRRFRLVTDRRTASIKVMK